MDKIIKVNFEKWKDVAYVDKGLAAWNYGQILQVEGLTLPDGNVEVHFSLTDHEGAANVYIGSVKDNILTVDIPDFIFQKENVFQPSYDAYAWIYVTDGESGRTIRKIVFTIDTRAEPTTNVPEDQKDKFLQEVRQVMAETKEIAQSVRDDADNGKFSGIPGEKGEDGKSAYQYAVEGGYKGTEQEFTELMGKPGEVDLTGYVSKEQHEAELLKAMVKVTTDKAPYHHITDSANYRVLDFGMEGITEQRTTSGKNLYSGGDKSGTVQTYKFAVNPIPAGTYTLSANVTSSDTDASQCLIALYNENGTYFKGISIHRGTKKSISFTTEYTIGGMCFYASNNGTSSADDTFSFTDIQIEPGEVATEYEPFTNGPTPNPTHPQEIKLAGVLNEETGRYEHKCCVGNKNFITHEDIINPNGLAVGEQNGYDSVEYNEQTGEYKFLKPKKVYNSMSYIVRKKLPKGKYTVSCVLIDTDGSDFSMSKIEVSKTTPYKLINNSVYKAFGEMVCTFELTEETEIQISFMQSSYYSTYTILKNIQLERDSTKTVFENGYNQPFTLTSDRPLTMWDKLVKRDGVWGWSINSIIYKPTGKEDVKQHNKESSGKVVYRFFLSGVKNLWGSKSIYCNKLRAASGYDIYTMVFTGYRIGVMMENNLYFASQTSDGVFESVDTFKEYLKTAGLEIVCEALTEQAFIPLPDEEQELLRNLETYYGVTNVYNEQGCPMWFKYCADQELHWNQKLLQIQQAII